jgi:D-glycero-D-manno-heptose 1,7-bisphosphate phosphatase
MVGDRWKDIEAGERAGCKTIFVDNTYSEKKPSRFNYSVLSLAEATDIILGK